MDGLLYTLVAILLFIVILGGLVLVHELGHYLTAKALDVRVLEFGIGFPPRAKVLRSTGRDAVDAELAADRRVRAHGGRGRRQRGRPALVLGQAAPGPPRDPRRGRRHQHRARLRHLLRHRAPREPGHRASGSARSSRARPRRLPASGRTTDLRRRRRDVRVLRRAQPRRSAARPRRRDRARSTSSGRRRRRRRSARPCGRVEQLSETRRGARRSRAGAGLLGRLRRPRPGTVVPDRRRPGRPLGRADPQWPRRRSSTGFIKDPTAPAAGVRPGRHRRDARGHLPRRRARS